MLLILALGRLAWFENPGDAKTEWIRHDISRRKRGMFDKFIARDVDGDGDIDFLGTRGNSAPYDGVFWLEQVRSSAAVANFQPGHKRVKRSLSPDRIKEKRGQIYFIELTDTEDITIE